MSFRVVPAVAVALLLTVAGCASGDADAAELPAGVDVSVYQTRLDFQKRQLEVTVANGSDADLVVSGVTFDSPQFVDSTRWEDQSTTLPPGVTYDLPVALPEADCDAVDPVPHVTIRFTQGAASGTARLVPDDRLDRLPALMKEDCLDQAVVAHATIEAVGLPQPTTVNGVAAARQEFAVIPTGASGSLQITEALGTILLALADDTTGAVIPTRPLDITVTAGSDRTTFALTLVPNRCDAHAIAEDKRGTIFPFKVSTDASAGTVFVAVPDATKRAFYDYLTTTCGIG